MERLKYMNNIKTSTLETELRSLKLEKNLLAHEINDYIYPEKPPLKDFVKFAKLVLKIQKLEKHINSFNKNTLEE